MMNMAEAGSRGSVAVSIILGGLYFVTPCAMAGGADGGGWTNYFAEAVEGGVNLPQPTNDVWRSGAKTNILQTLSKEGYRHKSAGSYSTKTGRAVADTMDFDLDGEGTQQTVRVSIVEGKSGRDDAMEGLSDLMFSYTSKAGVVYKIVRNGPGDICCQFRHTAGDGMQGGRVLFFCRDNVAVQVILRSLKGDVMPTARLVDAAIVRTGSRERSSSKGGDDSVAKAGAKVRDILTRKYGERPATSNALRDVRSLELNKLFPDSGFTGASSVFVIGSNDTEVVRAVEFNGPNARHNEQVRLLFIEGRKNVEAARKKLFEIMGSGTTVMITDATFRKIEHGPGDECFAEGNPAESDAVVHSIWFLRDNIGVKLACSGDRNLMILAKELDRTIVSQKTVPR